MAKVSSWLGVVTYTKDSCMRAMGSLGGEYQGRGAICVLLGEARNQKVMEPLSLTIQYP
jgi:hypothetical protein